MLSLPVDEFSKHAVSHVLMCHRHDDHARLHSCLNGQAVFCLKGQNHLSACWPSHAQLALKDVVTEHGFRQSFDKYFDMHAYS